jgi:hypothetical protein
MSVGSILRGGRQHIPQQDAAELRQRAPFSVGTTCQRAAFVLGETRRNRGGHHVGIFRQGVHRCGGSYRRVGLVSCASAPLVVRSAASSAAKNASVVFCNCSFQSAGLSVMREGHRCSGCWGSPPAACRQRRNVSSVGRAVALIGTSLRRATGIVEQSAEPPASANTAEISCPCRNTLINSLARPW